MLAEGRWQSNIWGADWTPIRQRIAYESIITFVHVAIALWKPSTLKFALRLPYEPVAPNAAYPAADPSTSAAPGNIDFTTRHREAYQWAIVGNIIHNQHWRQGSGTEAVRAALAAGFESLVYQRIEAAINLDNQASIALAQRVGMRQECILRGFFYENQQWVDHHIYLALLADVGLPEPPPKLGV